MTTTQTQVVSSTTVAPAVAQVTPIASATPASTISAPAITVTPATVTTTTTSASGAPVSLAAGIPEAPLPISADGQSQAGGVTVIAGSSAPDSANAGATGSAAASIGSSSATPSGSTAVAPSTSTSSSGVAASDPALSDDHISDQCSQTPVVYGPVLILAATGGSISAGEATLTFAPGSLPADAYVSVTVEDAPSVAGITTILRRMTSRRSTRRQGRSSSSSPHRRS